MKRIISLLIFTLLTSLLTAQEINSKPYIEIEGYAEKKVIPDEIYVVIKIQERESGRDKVSIDKQEADLKKALQALTISLENLKVINALADYLKVGFAKNEVVLQRNYELKLSSIEEVAKVFKKVDELKIHSAYISRISHSKINQFKKELEIEAIKAAKAKSDYLLEAIGQKTGSALVVYDLTTNNDESIRIIQKKKRDYNTSYRFLGEIEEDKSSFAKVTFREINLKKMMYVKFAIEQ